MTISAAPAGHRGPADLALLTEAVREVNDGADAVIAGMLVAGVDGLVLSAEVRGAQIDMVAAMAAIAAGIVGQLLEQAGVGESTACLLEGTGGHVAVFPLNTYMVLVVFGNSEVTMGRFNLAARDTLSRLRKTLARAGPLVIRQLGQTAAPVERPPVISLGKEDDESPATQ